MIEEENKKKIEIPEKIQTFLNQKKGEGKTVYLKLSDDSKIIEIDSQSKYRTTNYVLAAFLCLKGFLLENIVFDLPFIPQKGVFVFDYSKELEENTQIFYKNETQVSVQDFIRETNKLKHLLDDKMNRRGVYKYGNKPKKTE